MKDLLVSVFLFTLCTGCVESHKGLDVSGYVLEYGTLDPVEGARVYLVGGSAGGVYGPNWNLVDTFITGPDGKYSFRRSEEPVIVALYVYADQYYDIIEKAVKFPERKQEIDIVMDPYAWLKLNVRIVDFNPDLILRYYGGGGTHGNYLLGGGEINELNLIQGNRYQRIAWSATVGNNMEPFLDSIYVSAFDTVYYEIQY
ncbi:MAG TPA: hypothetical protein VI603_10210 [Saprospiraceae bacterium]|nr:hypothetical protein [Saprospiraceae bacterium]